MTERFDIVEWSFEMLPHDGLMIVAKTDKFIEEVEMHDAIELTKVSVESSSRAEGTVALCRHFLTFALTVERPRYCFVQYLDHIQN